MISVQDAERLAHSAHDGQVTSLGDPRFDHVMRVAGRVAADGDDLTVVAAILHDSVEKGRLDWDDLVDAGASAELVEIVDRLTERDGESEAAYLSRCASHPVALRVKEADLRDKIDSPVAASLAPAAAEAHRRRAEHRLALLNGDGREAATR